ncbi:MAG: hypothetical protein E7307_01370 [Butyrivibrio sp.]|nr:hypothetical protein [Butyrivibrio sp.]
MKYDEIVEMLEETGIPFAYHHFAEGESPDPPFIVFLLPDSDNFLADDRVYKKLGTLVIELYTDFKDPELEERLEDVLSEHELIWTRSEVWIDTEKMYEVRYEMTV